MRALIFVEYLNECISFKFNHVQSCFNHEFDIIETNQKNIFPLITCFLGSNTILI